MTNNQPFLTGFPTQICGSIRRRLQDVIAAKRRALTDSSIATYAMQFSHDLKLLHCFNPGDILCGDRAFCTYELISNLRQQREADSIMRLHQARHSALDWRKGKRMGKHQRLVIWKKPRQPIGSTLTQERWAALPAQMEIRLIRFYFEGRDGKKRRIVLATTLLDAEKYDWQELAAIYAQRWDIELRLRDVKTTLGLEHLRVKTPEPPENPTDGAHCLYNLIKSSCQEAAHTVGLGHLLGKSCNLGCCHPICKESP